MDSTSFNSTTVSGISMNSQQNILRDNYSLEEIFENKLRESVRLTRELELLSERDSSVVPEKTVLDFTTMVKDKNSLAVSLCDVVTNSEPFAYPKYRAEAYSKLTENLAKEEQSLVDLEKHLKAKKNQYSLRNRVMSDRCKQLQDIMDAEHSEVSKETDSVAVKLAQNMLDDSKKHLFFVLETLFPDNNKAIIEILETLEKASTEADEEQRWIKCTDMDETIVQYLLKSNIVKKHPQDREKIKLW